MAERRMFSKKVIDSDFFLDMPQTTQNLYFHLAMRADDDGFVGNPKRMIKMIGASDDDFKVLLSKQFILSFDSGIIVITHWKIHNYIQKDRYRETVYVDEKNALSLDDNSIYKKDTKCIQNVYNLDTQDRIGKDSIEIDKDIYISKNQKESKHKYGDYKNVLLSNAQYSKLLEEWGEQELSRMIKILDEGIQLKGYKYKDHGLAIKKWKKNESQQNHKLPSSLEGKIMLDL